jgi:hypothetical protein
LEGYIAIYLTAYVMLWKDILPVTLVAYVTIIFELKCSETKHGYKGVYYYDKNDPTLINNSTFRRSFRSTKI